ncbi:hypothetical protein [Acinetobacter boissieri]|uniref:Lipoprotein n=1 Tax=Acinetobacter boissieri TaxID=1219383 RepID=A0A1G6GUI1_9GAMM|nr:hypothetical protein [Acinetobacter boissieri]SDB84776.1 hypothetical protein SAMN05421733_102108 [Acinetobacter boissieri]
MVSTLKKTALLCLSLLTMACHQKESAANSPQVEKDPYGQPYYIGNLDGIKMKLGSAIEYVDYEICPVWTFDDIDPKCTPKPKRTYDSRFLRFHFTLYYPTDLLLLNFSGFFSTNDSKKKYEAERNDANNQWVKVSVESNKHVQAGYLKDILRNQTIETRLSDKEHLEKVNYINTYEKTTENVYGLQKYKPHPRWVENYSYKNITDLYVAYNSKGDVSTLITCNDRSPYPNARDCNQWFILSADTHVNIKAHYQFVNLKDWQIIQSKVLKQINHLKVL